MGLQMDNHEIIDIGITVNDVYIKITGIGLNGRTGECTAHVEYFINKNASDNGKMSIYQFIVCFTPTEPNGNLREQAYNYLKMIPEFSNCIDIFE